MLRDIFFTILCLERPSYIANQGHPILNFSFLLRHKLGLTISKVNIAGLWELLIGEK